MSPTSSDNSFHSSREVLKRVLNVLLYVFPYVNKYLDSRRKFQCYEYFTAIGAKRFESTERMTSLDRQYALVKLLWLMIEANIQINTKLTDCFSHDKKFSLVLWWRKWMLRKPKRWLKLRNCLSSLEFLLLYFNFTHILSVVNMLFLIQLNFTLWIDYD